MTYDVYLSIQNPYEFPYDIMTWEPGNIAEELFELGVFSEDEMNSVKMKPGKAAAKPVLVSLMKKKGYDGMKYTNQAEDKGSTSWIIFDPGQVKSVRNRGTWDKRRASIME
jgi:hypothetical protein